LVGESRGPEPFVEDQAERLERVLNIDATDSEAARLKQLSSTPRCPPRVKGSGATTSGASPPFIQLRTRPCGPRRVRPNRRARCCQPKALAPGPGRVSRSHYARALSCAVTRGRLLTGSGPAVGKQCPVCLGWCAGQNKTENHWVLVVTLPLVSSTGGERRFSK
jgi:hypothetical protein